MKSGTTKKIVKFHQIPDWFPQEKFNEHISKSLKQGTLTSAREAIFLKDLTNRMNDLSFVKNFQVSRQYSTPARLMSSIYATGKTRNSHTPFNFDVNVSNYGFDFKCGEARDINTFEINASYFLFRSGSLTLNFIHPFIDYPNFAKQKIFPTVSVKMLYDRRELYEQFYSKRGVESSIVNPSSSLSCTFLANAIKYSFTETHKPIFDAECTPFYQLGCIVDHNFQISHRFMFSISEIKTLTKINIEPNLIFDTGSSKNKIFPMLTSQFQTKMNLPFNGVLHFDSGFILCQEKIPFCKRFHLGGVPTMRGIRYGDFAPKVDGIPCGSDAYFAVGVDQILPIYYSDPRLQAHVFVNAGISRLSNKVKNTADFTSFLAYGGGFIVKIMDRTFEANFALPVSLSPDLKLMMFQVGIDTSSSEKK